MDSPIFVIGTGRSGTTLLRQMLDAHPRIHIAHESACYFYRSLAPQKTPDRQWLARYFDTFSFAWLRLDPREVLEELPAAGAIRAILRSKARARGKPRYGDKDPLNSLYLDRIFQDFPGARVIHMVRDPRATVRSLCRMPWAPGSILLNSLLCRVHFHRVRPYRDRILEVRLEDLVKDPRGTLHAILRFVGEPWDEAVLDHVRHASTDDVASLPWYAAATGALPGTPSGAEAPWTGLQPAAIRLIEQLNRAGMAHHGYQAAPLTKEPGPGALARLVLAELPEIARITRRVLGYRVRLGQHMSGGRRFDPQEAFAASLGLNPGAWRHYPGLRLPLVPRPGDLTGS